MKKLIISLIGFMLVACAPTPQHHLNSPQRNQTVVEYQNSNDMLWYYVLMTHVYRSNGTTDTNTYYYTSPSRLESSNYSSVPFKSVDQMDKSVAESTLKGIESSEQTNTQNIAVEDLPAEVQTMEAGEVAQAYAEYEQEQNSTDSANNSQESSGATESTSTDSGSSSSDSGSSDSGGGSSE